MDKSDLMFLFFFCKNFCLWSEDSKTPYMRPNADLSFSQLICTPTT